jgi:hypothetical protein
MNGYISLLGLGLFVFLVGGVGMLANHFQRLEDEERARKKSEE